MLQILNRSLSFMLMCAATSLLLAANTVDVPQKKPSSNPQEILGEEKLQVFETDELALDDSVLSESEEDQEFIDSEE